jgi:hypothetical protein
VRFVHDEPRDIELAEPPQELVRRESLGRDM